MEVTQQPTDRQVQARERSRRKLRIGRGFSLDPEDFIESCTAILGKRGMGKTGTTKVVEEEAIRVHVPFIALDPIGTHWGLRSSFDGKADGLKVLVVGGSHADIPFDRRAGATVADAIVSANVPAVVDYSEESHAAAREFITAFAAELYKKNDTGRLVIIEEASELLPQRLRPDMTGVYDVVERLVTRGRNRGLGVLLVDQRPARINKDVLTQIDSLWIMGVTSPQDRKALREWVEARADPDKLQEFMDGVTACKRQEAWIWSPGSQIFQKVHVRNFKTLHPDKTHLRRLGILDARAITTDVSPLIAKLGKDMERLSKERVDAAAAPRLKATSERLQHEVDELKKQLDEAKHAAPKVLPSDVRRAVDEATRPLRAEISELQARHKRVLSALRKVQGIARNLADVANSEAVIEGAMPVEIPRPAPPVTPAEARKLNWPKAVVAVPTPRPRTEPETPPEDGGELHLSKAHLKILAALAQLHGIGVVKPSKTQAALWAGYSPTSGGYYNYLGQLHSAGLIEYGADTTMYLTDGGNRTVDEMENPPEIPSNQDDLHRQIFSMVGASRSRILRVLIEYPDGFTKPELAERAGFSPTSGGYYNYLGTLRSMGLLDYAEGKVVPTGVLFL